MGRPRSPTFFHSAPLVVPSWSQPASPRSLSTPWRSLQRRAWGAPSFEAAPSYSGDLGGECPSLAG
eukprot:5825997-Pyramimonas_sp.AAC.1